MATHQAFKNDQAITYQVTNDDRYECLVCPHRCKLRNGQNGLCQVRQAQDGIFLKAYGKLSQIAIEPIEKKPIYHYRPNLKTLSCSGFSCNMSCDYCQNFMVSQVDKSEESPYTSPQDLVSLAIKKECQAICFTYNEPIIYFEYVMDVGELCKANNLDLIIKTNAFAEPEIWRNLCSVASAMNIDWKGNEERYRIIAKASEAPVLDSIESAIGKTHIEISVPVYSDATVLEHESFAEFMGRYPFVPIHLLKIYPAYKTLGCSVTSDVILRKIKNLYAQKSEYIYIQNLYEEGLQDTFCKTCGDKIATRKSLKTEVHKGSCCNYSIIKI